MCACLDRAKEIVDIAYQKPKGGVYLWVKLPAALDVVRLTKEAEQRGVSFIPGAIFFPGKDPGGNYIRLNYSYPTEEQIKKGMELLIKSMQKIQKESGFSPTKL